MDLKKSFGARIKEIRESRSLNQEQLAELLNIESRHLSRIETGKCFTTIENIQKIATALNVDIQQLFNFEHKNNREYLILKINEYLNNAPKEKLELSYKLIKSLFD